MIISIPAFYFLFYFITNSLIVDTLTFSYQKKGYINFQLEIQLVLDMPTIMIPNGES